MLTAARAHGKPMMVTAMMTAASNQPSAIQAPPKMIQRMFKSNDMAGPPCPAVIWE